MVKTFEESNCSFRYCFLPVFLLQQIDSSRTEQTQYGQTTSRWRRSLTRGVAPSLSGGRVGSKGAARAVVVGVAEDVGGSGEKKLVQ